MKKKILSFSLWGDIRTYCIGAIKNVLLASIYFPDWICRIYYDCSVPECIIDYLKKCNNVDLVYIKTPSGGKVWKQDGQFGSLWRYYVFNDEDVEIWAARDTDSRISPYEKQELDKFIESDDVIHGIRNTNEIFARGGTVALKNFNHGIDTRFVNNKKLDIFEMTKHINKTNSKFYVDEKFLVNDLFPLFSKKYSWSPRKPNIEHFDYLGQYVCQVLDEYDQILDKNGKPSFNSKNNYDDLHEMLDEYKIKIGFN
jgi:hypothetical protein